ncbi:MAG TPA: hypothetical protein VFV65_06790 [Gemmatimonadales bacterium]|nr:hypothetical protein [Gemmatimonadales bacterium]
MPERDAAERAQLLRIAVLLGPPILIIGGFTLFFAQRKELLPGAVLLVLLVLLLPATWGAILLVEASTTRSAQSVIHTLHAAGGPAARTGFSEMEALVARGRLLDAAAKYRLHIAAVPDDTAAMVALGRLLAGPLGDPDGAVEAYRAARKTPRAAEWERVVTTDLMDLYQRTGEGGKLRVELARFAAAARGTRAGEAALARLRGLKREDDPGGAGGG